MLAHPNLPESLIERCLDVLKEISPSEKELIRVTVEIIVELRDSDLSDEFLSPVCCLPFCLATGLTQMPYTANIGGRVAVGRVSRDNKKRSVS